MKAIVLNQKTNKLELNEIEKPKVSKTDVLVKLKTGVLN